MLDAVDEDRLRVDVGLRQLPAEDLLAHLAQPLPQLALELVEVVRGGKRLVFPALHEADEPIERGRFLHRHGEGGQLTSAGGTGVRRSHDPRNAQYL